MFCDMNIALTLNCPGSSFFATFAASWRVSSSTAHSDKIPTAIPMFSGSNFLMVPLPVSRNVDISQKYQPEIQDGGRQHEMYIFYGCMADERQFLIYSVSEFKRART